MLALGAAAARRSGRLRRPTTRGFAAKSSDRRAPRTLRKIESRPDVAARASSDDPTCPGVLDRHLLRSNSDLLHAEKITAHLFEYGDFVALSK